MRGVSDPGNLCFQVRGRPPDTKRHHTHKLDFDAVLDLVRPSHDAGIVNEDVEARRLRLDRLCRRLGGRNVGQVKLDKDEVVRLAGRRLVQAVDRVLRLFLVPAQEEDLAALLVELLSRDKADALIGTRDRCDLVAYRCQ